MTPSSLNKLRASHLVETDWLADHLNDADLRIVDMRGYVKTETQPDGSQTAQYLGASSEYEAGHIPRASYIDWTTDIVDLNDPVPAQVAPADKIAEVFGSLGIGDHTQVVVYDNHPASQFATRLWWVLRYYGHENVRVLNGGIKKWIAEGRPLTTDVPAIVPTNFIARVNPELRATAEEVLSLLGNRDVTLIDARDEGQYTGAIRRGPRGGHIPGAIHLPREAFFAPNGTFKDEQEISGIIREAGIDPGHKNVAYCNGGVAATSVLFALSMLGFPALVNYDGSWNEWGQLEHLPIE